MVCGSSVAVMIISDGLWWSYCGRDGVRNSLWWLCSDRDRGANLWLQMQHFSMECSTLVCYGSWHMNQMRKSSDREERLFGGHTRKERKLLLQRCVGGCNRSCN